MDSRLGQYNLCNPNPNTGIFACEPMRSSEAKCWYDNPEFVKTFGSVCDRKSCECAAVSELSVGSEKPPFQATATPQQRAASFSLAAHPELEDEATTTTTVETAVAADPCLLYWPENDQTFIGDTIETIGVTSKDQCCQACTEHFFTCRGYTMPNATSCTLWKNIRPPYLKPAPGVKAAYKSTVP